MGGRGARGKLGRLACGWAASMGCWVGVAVPTLFLSRLIVPSFPAFAFGSFDVFALFTGIVAELAVTGVGGSPSRLWV